MDNSSLQKRIEVLEKNWASLQQSNTIPINTDRALLGRGFIKLNSFIGGYGTLNVAGEYVLVIPGASAQSIVLASYVTHAGGELEVVIRASTSSPGNYEIYAQGTATEEFAYVVFLLNNNYTTI